MKMRVILNDVHNEQLGNDTTTHNNSKNVHRHNAADIEATQKAQYTKQSYCKYGMPSQTTN